MNRRIAIGAVAATALVIFGVAALLYEPTRETGPVVDRVPIGPPLTRVYSPSLGPDDAPVTITEFFDPACESCRAFHPIVKDIIEGHEGDVRVVLRYAAFHPTSEAAIRILEASRLQNKFEPVLERLLETQQQWAPHGRSPASVWSVLGGIGLDIDRARREVNMPDIVAVLNQDAADIKTLGVQQTPTFFVNGRRLEEFGEQQLRGLVESEMVIK